MDTKNVLMIAFAFLFAFFLPKKIISKNLITFSTMEEAVFFQVYEIEMNSYFKPYDEEMIL